MCLTDGRIRFSLRCIVVTDSFALWIAATFIAPCEGVTEAYAPREGVTEAYAPWEGVTEACAPWEGVTEAWAPQ